MYFKLVYSYIEKKNLNRFYGDLIFEQDSSRNNYICDSYYYEQTDAILQLNKVLGSALFFGGIVGLKVGQSSSVFSPLEQSTSVSKTPQLHFSNDITFK